MSAEDEEAVSLEMAQLEREAQETLEGEAPKVGVQVRCFGRWGGYYTLTDRISCTNKPSPTVHLPSAPQTKPVGQPAPEVTKEEVAEERQAVLAE